MGQLAHKRRLSGSVHPVLKPHFALKQIEADDRDAVGEEKAVLA
ncbi:MAG TPA: hypothetical protein VN924_28530 [Bryobacteraceae bacterium]|nr:hypothetical protein [Bryobacteraceae bacterium]